jgi:cytochrome o ubiquinol oxidase subunit II
MSMPPAPPRQNPLPKFVRPIRPGRWSGLLALLVLLAGCSGGVLQPQGPIGSANVIILLDALAIMGVIVVPTLAAIVGFAWWFRASNPRAVYRPDFVYEGRLELLVWAVPILIIMFLGGVIWIGSYELDPFRPIGAQTAPSAQTTGAAQTAQAAQTKPLDVDVISLDWKWLFIYPDRNVASVNEIVVPAGTPVHFHLTSASVMNSFFVPQLGSMIACMNRMVTQLHLQADTPGDYYGQSAQFSGDGFSTMHFVLRAVPQDAFDAWVAGARKDGPVLDRKSYTALAQPSERVSPFTYSAVEPGLFEAVATQKIPPGPGPSAEAGPTQIRPKTKTER